MLSWLAGSALASAFGPGIFARIGAAVMHDFTAAVDWLSRDFWRVTTLIACIYIVITHFELIHWKHSSAKWESQYTTLHTENEKLTARIKAADKAIADQAAQIRKANDETNRLIAGDAGSLRLSGPGRSICRPGASGSSSEHSPGAKPNASGPPLPPDDLSAVPWDWLVTRSEEHDQLRAEVQAWHDWYGMLVKNWPNDTKPRQSS